MLGGESCLLSPFQVLQQHPLYAHTITNTTTRNNTNTNTNHTIGAIADHYRAFLPPLTHRMIFGTSLSLSPSRGIINIRNTLICFLLPLPYIQKLLSLFFGPEVRNSINAIITRIFNKRRSRRRSRSTTEYPISSHRECRVTPGAAVGEGWPTNACNNNCPQPEEWVLLVVVGGGYITVPARMEPELLVHTCGRDMETNLRRPF